MRMIVLARNDVVSRIAGVQVHDLQKRGRAGAGGGEGRGGMRIVWGLPCGAQLRGSKFVLPKTGAP